MLPCSIPFRAWTIVKLLAMRMNVLTAVRGMLRGVSVAGSGQNDARVRRARAFPMIAEKNMISETRKIHIPSFRWLTWRNTPGSVRETTSPNRAPRASCRIHPPRDATKAASPTTRSGQYVMTPANVMPLAVAMAKGQMLV